MSEVETDETVNEEELPEDDEVVQESDSIEAEEEADYVTLEDMTNDEEEFVPGVTIGQLKAWKEQYGRLYTATIFADLTVIFRPISRMEYSRHVKNMEELNNKVNLSPAQASLRHEESLTQIALLFPKYNPQDPKSLAGIPSLIAQNIMEGSGFNALAVREL